MILHVVMIMTESSCVLHVEGATIISIASHVHQLNANACGDDVDGDELEFARWYWAIAVL